MNRNCIQIDVFNASNINCRNFIARRISALSIWADTANLAKLMVNYMFVKGVSADVLAGSQQFERTKRCEPQ